MSTSVRPRYLDGAALRRERMAAGLEQWELAERVNENARVKVKQGQISGWERKHTGCRLAVLHELATALGIDASRLMLPDEDDDAEAEPEEAAA